MDRAMALLFYFGVGLCALLAFLTALMVTMLSAERMVQRSPVFLILQNLGALVFFVVVLLYFARVSGLPFYIDAIGDLGQCCFLWAALIRCYRLYWVTAPINSAVATSSLRQRATSGRARELSALELESAAAIANDDRHSTTRLLKWYIFAIFICEMYNLIWDFVRLLPGTSAQQSFLVRLVAYSISGAFYLAVFGFAIYKLRGISDYYRQSTELMVLAVVCVLTRVAVIYHALVRATSSVPQLTSMAIVMAALLLLVLVSALHPVLQTGIELWRKRSAIFPELGFGTERNPLIDARLRSHAVSTVVTLVPSNNI